MSRKGRTNAFTVPYQRYCIRCGKIFETPYSKARICQGCKLPKATR